MMVCLKQGRSTALEQDNGSINHLVEFRQVKEVAPETERILPQESVLVTVLLFRA